jgi:hypothetical protein
MVAGLSKTLPTLAFYAALSRLQVYWSVRQYTTARLFLRQLDMLAQPSRAVAYADDRGRKPYGSIGLSSRWWVWRLNSRARRAHEQDRPA